jgi:RNA polymerase sigma-70 factor, ECF subfamily
VLRGVQYVVVGEFAVFFRAEQPRLVALVMALTGSVEVARDIAQEALVRTYQRWPEVGEMERPGAWSRRVAINLTWNEHRRRGREDRAIQRVGEPAPLLPADPVSDRFWARVRELPDRQRAVVALHYLDDLSVADVADILDCAEGTVKSLLFKARTKLAESLAGEVAS